LLATLRAVESAYLEFRRQSRAGMKRVVGAHTLALYERTRLFRMYEHNVIPGLFQTAGYCSAMLSFWIRFLGAPNDLEEAVATRMERQRVIYHGAKRFIVVLEEQALLGKHCGQQTARIAAIHPNVRGAEDAGRLRTCRERPHH
jgi:hypothetical protein